jgi:hypothetical protein
VHPGEYSESGSNDGSNLDLDTVDLQEKPAGFTGSSAASALTAEPVCARETAALPHDQ